MSVSAARAHFRSDTDGFHDFLGHSSMPHRRTGMAADAIRALRHMGDRNCDQLLGLRRNRTFSEDAFAKGLEGRGRPGCKMVSLLGDLPSGVRIHLLVF